MVSILVDAKKNVVTMLVTTATDQRRKGNLPRLPISSLVEFSRSAVVNLLDFQIANDASPGSQADPAKDVRRTTTAKQSQESCTNHRRNAKRNGSQRAETTRTRQLEITYWL